MCGFSFDYKLQKLGIFSTHCLGLVSQKIPVNSGRNNFFATMFVEHFLQDLALTASPLKHVLS
jgi:hypothetical protein